MYYFLSNVFFIKIFFALFINITTSYFIPIFYYTQNKNIYSWHFCLLLFSKLYHFIGTRFVDPPFKFFNSSLLWDVFIINSVKQLQTWPKTQSEIDISPFLKTQKWWIKKYKKRGGPQIGYLCIIWEIVIQTFLAEILCVTSGLCLLIDITFCNWPIND